MKPSEKDTIQILSYPDGTGAAKVIDLLSKQFTCEDGRGRVLFFFYADEGVTWKRSTGERIKPRRGASPPILGKGAAHQDKTKYTRKEKHKGDPDE